MYEKASTKQNQNRQMHNGRKTIKTNMEKVSNSENE